MKLQENIRQALMEMVMDVNESKGWGESKQKLEKTFTTNYKKLYRQL